MSSPFVVADGWKITDWVPGPAVEGAGIPADGFKVPGPLVISPESASSPDNFRLEWLNEREEPCAVSGVRPALEAPELLLTGQNLFVSFGSLQVVSNVDVVLDPSTNPKTLTLALSLPEPQSADEGRFSPNVGSGTVTATANPDLPSLVEVVAVHESISG
ncbi:MAG TPA: hypothetical protein VGG20_08505 [Thermoanaerobaculia bacterium]|jgi:hypothetical protein